MEEFQLGGGWKVFMWVFGILATPIFLLGLPMIYLAVTAKVQIDDQGLTYWWLTKKQFKWDEVGSVNPAPAANLLGAMMKPHFITHAVTGKRSSFPVGTFKDGGRMMSIIEQRMAG